MKNTFVVLMVILFMFTISNAQTQLAVTDLSEYSLTQSANIPQQTYFFLSAGTDFFNSQSTSTMFRGQVRLGIANTIELAAIQQEGLIDPLGNVLLVPQWEVKFNILEPTNIGPALSFSYRSNFSWKLSDLFSQDISLLKPDLYCQGLNGVRYEQWSSSGTFILSKKVTNFFDFTAALGVQEVQSRDMWIFINPAPIFSNGYHDAENKHTMMLNGYINARFALNSKFILFAEGMSLPVTSLNISAMNLEYQRGYIELIGLRYTAFRNFSFDVLLAHNPVESNSSEFQAKFEVITMLPF